MGTKLPASPVGFDSPADRRGSASAVGGAQLPVCNAFRRVLRPAPATADQYDVSQCVAAVGGPRVALMFLTRAGLPYEQLWAEWLGSAAGLLPAQHVQARSQCRLNATSPYGMLSPTDARTEPVVFLPCIAALAAGMITCSLCTGCANITTSASLLLAMQHCGAGGLDPARAVVFVDAAAVRKAVHVC